MAQQVEEPKQETPGLGAASGGRWRSRSRAKAPTSRSPICPKRRREHCRGMVERVIKEFGRIDLLVNNAAYQMTHQKIEQVSTEEFEHTFRTSIFAMFYLAKACLPQMKPGSGIINTASVQAYQPDGMLLAYAATKGAVCTPLIPSTMPREKVEQFGQHDPMKRPAQPAELAPAYVYLASGDSSYVTGSVMDLTGGEMLP